MLAVTIGKLRVLFLSVVLVIPCLWHRRIESGDLASHAYNAWLAQLIEKGQAPGLYIAKQWKNIEVPGKRHLSASRFEIKY